MMNAFNKESFATARKKKCSNGMHLSSFPVVTPPTTHVRSHILRNVSLQGWNERIAGRWHYRDLAADPDWRHGWISFDAVCTHPIDGMVYCGMNSIDGDLLYRFDPSSGDFLSLETQQWTDRFDAKIHRTLLASPRDGNLYFGTSLLHDADQQHEAVGGKLVRYDPFLDRYELLGIPFPHLYLQSIAADWEREIIYAYTYPAEFLLRFDLRTRTTTRLAYVGNAMTFSQPHNSVVDSNGALWGTYAETRAWDETPGRAPIRIFRYHPDTGFDWFEHGLSRRSEEGAQLVVPESRYAVDQELRQTRHRDDYGFCDSMAYDGKRHIYAGTVAGVLCRIDTADGSVTRLAHLTPSGRLPALEISDGILYAAGGMRSQTQAFRWEMETRQVEDLGDLIDPATGDRPARIHELTVRGSELYMAENDNHTRSSYLWQVSLGNKAS